MRTPTQPPKPSSSKLRFDVLLLPKLCVPSHVQLSSSIIWPCVCLYVRYLAAALRPARHANALHICALLNSVHLISYLLALSNALIMSPGGQEGGRTLERRESLPAAA